MMPSMQELNDSAVEAYLLENPDFFKDKTDLLAQLRLPHGGDGAVSLVERQQAALRERNVELRHQLSELTRQAEANDKRFEQTRSLIQNLVRADSRVDIRASFERSLTHDFGNDYAALHWLDSTGSPLEAIKSLIKNKGKFLGPLRESEMRALFGARANAGSACIVGRDDSAILAIGSNDASAFTNQTGTLFIDHVADVTAVLSRKLDS